MDGSKIRSEDHGANEHPKIPDERERAKIAAINYVELSLADPSYGDARRDELALAALGASVRCSRQWTFGHN